MSLTWKCHICGEERPDHLISVHKRDSSEEYGLPPGTMGQNIRFCNDNPMCREEAHSFSFLKKD
jgi:hypothetical protein